MFFYQGAGPANDIKVVNSSLLFYFSAKRYSVLYVELWCSHIHLISEMLNTLKFTNFDSLTYYLRKMWLIELRHGQSVRLLHFYFLYCGYSIYALYLSGMIYFVETNWRKTKNHVILVSSAVQWFFLVYSCLICILVENIFIYRKPSGDYLSRMLTKSSISTVLRKRRWKVWQLHLHMYIWSTVSFVCRNWN
jgi:hypothetical protein